MRSARHVPINVGLLFIAGAAFVIVRFDGWWTYVVGTLLLAFGWPSLKTGFVATDKEFDELTGKRAMTGETSRRLKDRV